jgi:hypothetical protein
MTKYIVNTNTKTIHQSDNIKYECFIEKVNPDHRVDTDNAKSYLDDGYNGCGWCYKEKHVYPN